MGELEERIAHLKADIEELRVTAEKSQVAFTTSKKYFEDTTYEEGYGGFVYLTVGIKK